MANIIAVYPLVGGKAQEEILSPLHEQKVSQRRTDLYTAAMLGSSWTKRDRDEGIAFVFSVEDAPQRQTGTL